MEEIVALLQAKFPPNQVPALLAEMKAQRATVEDPGLGLLAPVLAAYQHVLLKGDALLAALAQRSGYDPTRLDGDLDNSGYAIHDALEAKLRAFSSQQLPLSPEEKQAADDARVLLGALYPKGKAPFNYPYVAEWNAVATMLQTAAQPEHSARIQRLGLGLELGRLQRCHQAFGALIGISSHAEAPAAAEFEEALHALLALVIAYYGRNEEKHQRWREVLAGPYQRHVEAYRERRRRGAQAPAPTPEPAAPSHDD